MTKAEFDVPVDKEAWITRNAMLVYPYIKNGVISHGKAAEMLGLHKIDLITLYGKFGLPYFDETDENEKIIIPQVPASVQVIDRQHRMEVST